MGQRQIILIRISLYRTNCCRMPTWKFLCIFSVIYFRWIMRAGWSGSRQSASDFSGSPYHDYSWEIYTCLPWLWPICWGKIFKMRSLTFRQIEMCVAVCGFCVCLCVLLILPFLRFVTREEKIKCISFINEMETLLIWFGLYTPPGDRHSIRISASATSTAYLR